MAVEQGFRRPWTLLSLYPSQVSWSLFFSLAEKGYAMIGLEAVGMSIEDIFLTIVEKSSETRTKYDTRKRRSKATTRTSLETSVAESILEKNSSEE